MSYSLRPHDQPAFKVACPVCPAKSGEPCIGTTADFHYAREDIAARKAKP